MDDKQRREIDEALKQLKRLAAHALVRKEGFADELQTLEKRRADLEANLEGAVEKGDDDLALEIIQAKDALAAQIVTKSDDVGRTAAQVDQAMNERKDLQRSAEELEQAERRAVVSDAVNPDPFDMSAESVALRNVREHIAGLDAQVELDQEMHGADRDLKRKLADLEKQEAEEKAKAELAELKAKFKQKADAPATEKETAEPPEKKRRPKRTM